MASCGALVTLAACGDNQRPLPGEREPIRLTPTAAEASEVPATVPPLRLPPARAVTEWTHLNGDTTHLAPHVQLNGDLRRAWSASIGTGAGRRQRLTAAPVVSGGVVYALDAATTVSAISAADGRVLWRTGLTPLGERGAEGFGGGVSVGSGAVVVTTGFGEVARLDPGNGGIFWRTQLAGAARAAPTVAGSRAIVVTRGDLAYGVDLETGGIDWQLEGIGEGAGLIGGSSAAVRGPVAVLPFQSGELRAVLVRSGLTVWTAAVTGGRRDIARATISDISGDPVIDNDVVYAANQAGRLVALDRRSGNRIWTQQDGAYGPALSVGGSLFLVTDQAELVRLAAADGTELWRTALPGFRTLRRIGLRRRREALPHFGPLLAGGRLMVASGDARLRYFDPTTGADLGTLELPGRAAAQPAIAGGTLYLITTDGRLHAFR